MLTAKEDMGMRPVMVGRIGRRLRQCPESPGEKGGTEIPQGGICVLEDLLVRCCAPTLAGFKTASVFSVAQRDRRQLQRGVRELNSRLEAYGLRILILRCREGKALLYVYLPEQLEEYLRRDEVSALLTAFGYPRAAAEERLACLRRRLEEGGEFPHEIGLFLGYPAEDVEGFIRHGARDCKCCGFWKVYGDEDSAKRQFALFRRCTACCCDFWRQGMSIEEILERRALIA